jgi:hypothetical protein
LALLKVGGTGLEPVTPSLSSPQSCYSALAGTPLLWPVCRTVRTLSGAAFALVLGLPFPLLLAPVSTGTAAVGSFPTDCRADRSTALAPCHEIARGVLVHDVGVLTFAPDESILEDHGPKMLFFGQTEALCAALA